MEIFSQISPLIAFLKKSRLAGRSVGLVPTMGALHDGHLSLVEASKASNDVTITTIFVNPTQFNNPADLANYPRSLDVDTELLKKVGCDVLFCPNTDEMYPSESVIQMSFGPLEEVMEGKYRPGHFKGVGLIVSKFFNLICPDRAYFGQKDWQQFVIISRLIQEFKYNIELIPIPTLREEDGLAKSSRNTLLNTHQRKKATIFYESLSYAREATIAGVPFVEIKQSIGCRFESCEDVGLDYVELVDSSNLRLINSVKETEKPVICIAGYVGDVRLIDNMFIDL